MEAIASEDRLPQPGSPTRATCPTRLVLDRVADKWAVLILGLLGDETGALQRQLRRRIEGISQKDAVADPQEPGARRARQPQGDRDGAGDGGILDHAARATLTRRSMRCATGPRAISRRCAPLSGATIASARVSAKTSSPLCSILPAPTARNCSSRPRDERHPPADGILVDEIDAVGRLRAAAREEGARPSGSAHARLACSPSTARELKLVERQLDPAAAGADDPVMRPPSARNRGSRRGPRRGSAPSRG